MQPKVLIPDSYKPINYIKLYTDMLSAGMLGCHYVFIWLDVNTQKHHGVDVIDRYKCIPAYIYIYIYRTFPGLHGSNVVG